MKSTKIILFSLSLTVALLLTGCIDTIQYISDDGRNINVNFRLTLQKAIFKMMASMDNEEINDDYFRNNFGQDEIQLVNKIPHIANFNISEINTDFDYGFEVKIKIAKKALSELVKNNQTVFFIPVKKDKSIEITLPPLNESESNEDNDYAEAFLASAKYRLIINKSYIKKIKNISIKNKNSNTDLNLSVFDYGEIYIVEFPMYIWFSAAKTPLVITINEG